MTNKEAIEQLKWVQKRICDITYSPESFEAIDLATKALEESEQLAEWLKELKAYKEASKGDLISREALIEDFKSRLADCNDWIENAKDKETKIRASAVKTFICEVIMTIDNAPTVFDEKAYSDGYTQGTCDCEHAHERPQGEWLKSDIPESVLAKCSICGFDCGSYTYNFCPNCGADMRGDKNGKS